MTETRTAWQQIMVTSEELHQEEVIVRLFERVQFRLHCERVYEHMKADLWIEFAKLTVNHCAHPIYVRQTIVHPGDAVDPPLPTCRMCCTDCWTTLEAAMHTNGTRAWVVYNHSVPVLVTRNTSGNSTLTIASSGAINGQYHVMDIQQNTTPCPG